MRFLGLFSLLVGGCLCAQSQVVKVQSVEKIALPNGQLVAHAELSPDGNSLLLSGAGYEGLKLLDLKTNEMRVISEAAGAGYGAKMIGNTIVYRETSFNADRLRMQTLKSKNLATGKTEILQSASHDLQSVVATDNAVMIVNAGKMQAHSLSAEKSLAKLPPVPSISNGKLMLTSDGVTREFCPNGTYCRYIWPSISPDGSKVLYYVSGEAAYVCDIDGKNVKRLGILRAPKWVGNDMIVGMLDTDDGHFVQSSKIIIKCLTTDAEQTLTDSSLIAMYPSVNADGSKILFSTPSGDAYVINITLENAK